MMRAEGQFGYVDGTAKNAGLSGSGALSWDAASGWHFICKRAHSALRIPMGVIGAAVGVVLVALGATLLDDMAGIDLMGYRKGPVLVGMIGLLVAIGGWTAMTWLADMMFGRAYETSLGPGLQVTVRPHSSNAKRVSLFWAAEGKTVGTSFQPVDEQHRGQLLAMSSPS